MAGKRRTTRRTPLAAVGKGLVAGAAGTAVMTGYQLLVARLRSDGEDSGGDAPPEEPRWEDAPAPAQVARRVIEGVFQREVPASRIGLLTNATHWAYGTLWGGAYALARDSLPAPAPVHGALFGMEVWAASYVALVPMGLYEPPWKYPPSELAIDVSYHAVYGLAVAGAYRAIARPA